LDRFDPVEKKEEVARGEQVSRRTVVGCREKAKPFYTGGEKIKY
jgi:hypothetical protein